MRAIGIEVNSASVRFVELEKQADGVRLVSALTVPTVMFDPDCTDTDAAFGEADELLAKYAQAGLSYSRGVIGVSGRELMLRYMKIADAPPVQQRAMIELELDDLVGEDAESIIHDYIGLRSDLGADEQTMLVAMTKNEFLEGTVKNLAKLKVKPTRITPSTLGLFNAFLLGGEVSDTETVLVASIGFAETEMCIVRGGELMFARNINNGGKALAEVIAEAKGMPTAKAWRLVLAKSDFSSGATDGLQARLLGATDQLARGLESSINFARLQLRVPRLAVDRVVLTGDLCRIKGIKEVFQKTLGKPVELLNPFATLEAAKIPDACRRGDNDPIKFPYQYGVAAGLARIGLEAHPFAVNLEPKSVGTIRQFVHQSLFLYGSVAVAMIAMALMVISAGEAADTTQKAQQRAQMAKANVERQVQAFDKARQSYQAAEPAMRSVRAALLPTYQFLDAMNAIRAFADAHEELIVESIDFVPPRERDIRASYTMAVVLYFTDTAPEGHQPLIQQLTTKIREMCGESVRPDGLVPTEMDLDANSPLKTGEKYLLQITFAQP